MAMAKQYKYELKMEGENLGTRHRYLNSQVNKIVQEKPLFEAVISESGNSAVDHLFKIDVANKYKNVKYIFEVLKSEDMLHVSRAIKNISWLITDDQYSNIINPEYLHSELFPQMQTKAICKLLLHIRLHLKDEKRVDEFYKHQAAVDVKKAIKWLPYCSLTVIKQCLDEHNFLIEHTLFNRLCEKYPEIFDTFIDKNKYNCNCQSLFSAATITLQNDTKHFLDKLETFEVYYWPQFGKRRTSVIMKRSPDRIQKNLKKYYDHINFETFAKYIAPENAKDIVIDLLKFKNVDRYTFQKFKVLITRIPKEERFDFLKGIFIDYSIKEKACDKYRSIREILSSENIYQWYIFAPFDVAFIDLKNLIKTESSADDRNAMLKVLIKTTRSDMGCIERVLIYYRDKHINEVFKHKIDFIDGVITNTPTHRYSKTCWNILDELFHSAGVYMESDKNLKVKSCIEAIIVYKILHKEPIPEIIMKKFVLKYLKSMKNLLQDREKEEIFDFLFNHIEEKIASQSMNDQNEVNELKSRLDDMINFLVDWDKELDKFPILVNKIKELAHLRLKELKINLHKIYRKYKPLRKALFEESLLISHCDSVYLNILKHDPSILKKYTTEVETHLSNDKIILRQILFKLKIYFPEHSLTLDWIRFYKNLLHSNDYKCREALTRGLCALLPHQEVQQLLNNYSPDVSKIDWTDIDENLFHIRKNFAQQMYRTRPQPPIETILRYAVGDYIQYALPSLNSIYHIMSTTKSVKCIPYLLAGNIVLQKLGIRFAFSRLNYSDVMQLFSETWNSSKNITVKAEIFKLSFKLLCQEKNESKIKSLWSTMELFFDNLSTEENPVIYKLLRYVNKVPICVREQFFVRSYSYLKTLPPKANCQKIIDDLVQYSTSVIGSVDPDFGASVLLETYDKWTDKFKIYYNSEILSDVVAKYLLCAKEAEDQDTRYANVIKPLLSKVFTNWDVAVEADYVYKDFLQDFLKSLIKTIVEHFVDKKHVDPLHVVLKIQKAIEKHVNIECNYKVITMCRLIAAYVESHAQIDKSKLQAPGEEYEFEEEKKLRYQTMWNMIVPIYAQATVKLLKHDIDTLYPSALCLFDKPLTEILNILILYTDRRIFERELLKDSSNILSCLLAVAILPKDQFDRELTTEVKEICKLIMEEHCNEVKAHCSLKFDTSFDNENSDHNEE